VRTDRQGIWGSFLEGRGRGNREFFATDVSFFSIRELFWRLGVGYASYGQLPRFDSKQNEKEALEGSGT
jgi:hypothetical protein